MIAAHCSWFTTLKQEWEILAMKAQTLKNAKETESVSINLEDTQEFGNGCVCKKQHVLGAFPFKLINMNQSKLSWSRWTRTVQCNAKKYKTGHIETFKLLFEFSVNSVQNGIIVQSWTWWINTYIPNILVPINDTRDNEKKTRYKAGRESGNCS